MSFSATVPVEARPTLLRRVLMSVVRREQLLGAERGAEVLSQRVIVAVTRVAAHRRHYRPLAPRLQLPRSKP